MKKIGEQAIYRFLHKKKSVKKPKEKYFERLLRLGMNTPFLFFTLLMAVFISACSTTKSLQDDELLYKGADINIEGKSGFRKMGIKSQLKDYKTPEPNKRIFGFYPL